MNTTTDAPFDILDLLLALAVKSGRAAEIKSSMEKLEQLQDHQPISLGSILEENAVKFRDRPAVYFEEEVYTHHAFNGLVNQYAHYLQGIGVGKGTVAVIYLENRLATVVLIAALSKLGAVASLINANQRERVLQHSIEADQGRYFLIGAERVAAFEAIREHLTLSSETIILGIGNGSANSFPPDYLPLHELAKEQSRRNPATTRTVTLGDRFANVFTSGTTGMPKASMQTHRKWYTCYLWYGKMNLNLNASDVLYVAIPYFHTNALIVAWPSAAAGGAAMAIRRRLSISNFWKDVRRYDVSAFIYIGEICRYLMNRPETPQDASHRVRKIIGNGLRPDIWKPFKKRFGIAEVYELYGASDSPLSFTNIFNLNCTVGTNRAEYAIVKYDAENDVMVRNQDGFMERVVAGEPGLLLARISPETHLPGYVNPAKNREKMLHDVLEMGDLWFNTGDLIREVGFGHVQFVDRMGDTFRWKGENVSTAEVEANLNLLPQVAHSAVYGIALPDTDGRAGMAALLPATPVEEWDWRALTNALRDLLPSYSVPIFLRLVPEFAKTATHKIQKAVLKKEGLIPPKGSGDIYVLLPGADAYQPLSETIREDIKRGAIPF